MAAGGSTKAVVTALVGNSLIGIAKLVAFFLTGSSSMLAEAVHSFADSGNQSLLLWGGKAAKKDADDEHQFGYGRERYFWSFVVALVLFAMGSGFAIYEGIEKIRHPHEIKNIGIALGVLGFGIVVEAFAFATAIKESRPLKGNMSWWQFIRRSRTPELPVVLLEDFGAQVGLIFAFIAVSIAHWGNAPVWDGIGTLAIGILLFFIACILIVEMRSLLIGEGADERDMRKIIHATGTSRHVQKIIHLRTQHLGPEELLVAAKIDFEDGLTVEELAEAINEIERNVRAEVPYARPMYIEPALNVAPVPEPAADDDHH